MGAPVVYRDTTIIAIGRYQFMDDAIVFDANFAGDIKQVKLYQPPGANSGAVWHIMIGGYYNGSIIKRDDTWGRLHSNSIDWFTATEVDILGSLVDDHLARH